MMQHTGDVDYNDVYFFNKYSVILAKLKVSYQDTIWISKVLEDFLLARQVQLCPKKWTD